jgi:F-type H+-transporting ATPase subunit delta
MAAAKKTKQLAKQLLKLSVVNGQVSADQVTGVLGWVQKTNPPQSLTLLKLYQRLITAELAKSQAVITHAGPLGADVLNQITAAMTKKYGRPVTASAKLDSSLLAGLRVRVGNDVYETSVANQLATLGI